MSTEAFLTGGQSRQPLVCQPTVVRGPAGRSSPLRGGCLLTLHAEGKMRRWLLVLLIGGFLLTTANGIPQNLPSLSDNIVQSGQIDITEADEQFDKEVETSGNVREEETKKEGELAVSSGVVEQTEEAASPSPDTLKPITEIKTTTTAKPIAVAPVKPVKPIKPLAEESPAVTPTTKPQRRYPCRCGSGICSCCTGLILENFNVPIRSKACANITYEPDEFAFNFKLLYNDRILYDTRMSAKNPRPVCIPINRYFGVKMCAKLSNVYMSGRNIHACLNMEGFWDDESAFNYSFNCFRIGSSGVAVVRPEDGGGLPPPPAEEEEIDEDYDDTA